MNEIYYGLIAKTKVNIESNFVLENELPTFWELTEHYLALLEFLEGFCEWLSVV